MQGLEGVALGVGGWVCADPAADTTNEVEVVGECVDDREACLGDVDGVGGGDPDKDERVRGGRDGEREDHL